VNSKQVLQYLFFKGKVAVFNLVFRKAFAENAGKLHTRKA